MAHPMDAFETFLDEHEGTEICTITPGGNHGDTLIHMGMVKKLEEAGCNYSCINLEDEYRKSRILGAKYLINIAAWKLGWDRGFRLLEIPEGADLILFDGGGYMNDVWYGMVLLRQVLRRHSQPVAVAPHSFWFKGTDLMSLFAGDRPVTLFCRETYSFDLLSGMRKTKKVSVLLSKDTALYLNRKDLEAYIRPSDENYDLICFRNDKESIIPNGLRREIVEGLDRSLVCDISIKGGLDHFVSTIANAERIHTDRLHVAIVGHILRKETTLYDNLYHKNRGVYEYSLKADPKIKFIEVPQKK